MDREGPLTLAGAICYLAAAQHSKDAGHQQQLAATFYADCREDFTGVRIDAATEAFMADLLKSFGKHK